MEQVIMDSVAMERSLGRIAHQILERNGGSKNIALVGVMTRGVDLANRLSKKIAASEGVVPPMGVVDITLYRDDFREIIDTPHAKSSDIRFDLTGRDIILIDDVLFTGRTTRAAIEAILDFGRPKTIQLAVIVDRGGRELPIAPDYVGTTVALRSDEYVQVKTVETDKEDMVLIVEKQK
jgi:pyrimidine operon attenuation protein / uracil phosphoribosyltransferase